MRTDVPEFQFPFSTLSRRLLYPAHYMSWEVLQLSLFYIWVESNFFHCLALASKSLTTEHVKSKNTTNIVFLVGSYLS